VRVSFKGVAPLGANDLDDFAQGFDPRTQPCKLGFGYTQGLFDYAERHIMLNGHRVARLIKRFALIGSV